MPVFLALLEFWVNYAHLNAKMSDYATFYAIMLNAKWITFMYMCLKTWLETNSYHVGNSIRI